MDESKRIPFHFIHPIDQRNRLSEMEAHPPKVFSWSATHKAYSRDLSQYGEKLKRRGKI